MQLSVREIRRMSRRCVSALMYVSAITSGLGQPVGSAPKAPQPVPAANQPLRIERYAAGPIRLGMPREAAANLAGFKIAPATLRLEGDSVPVLRYERKGEVVAVAELDDGRVSRIRVLSSQFSTPEGVHVGSSAREMAKRYGTGKVLSGEGNVCAVFAKCPGRSFCFRTTPDLLVNPDWKKVAARNPLVEVILVVSAN